MAERLVAFSIRGIDPEILELFRLWARSHGGQAKMFEKVVRLRAAAVALASRGKPFEMVAQLLRDTGTEEVRA